MIEHKTFCFHFSFAQPLSPMCIFFSGTACRHQVNSYLRQRYKTLEEAEEDLHINYFGGGLQECPSEEPSNIVTSTPQSRRARSTPLSPVLAHSPHSICSSVDTEACFGDSIAKVIKLLVSMSSRMRQDLLQNLFYQYMFLDFDHDFQPFIPSDFIDLCCKGINVLHQNGKENIVYYLAKGLGTPRRDGTGPRLPIDRMPFGLLSYNIRYFALDKINNISSDPHYVQWETTMFSNFGHKWICLQRGPGFAYYKDKGEELSVPQSTCAPVCGPDSSTSSPGILQQAWQETFQEEAQTGGEANSEVHAASLAGAIDGGHIENFVETRDGSRIENLVEVIGGLQIESPVESSGMPRVGDQVVTGNQQQVGDVVDVEESVVASDLTELGDEEDVGGDSQDHTLSYLWVRLSTEEREEVANGDNPADLARFHGVCPQPAKTRNKEVDAMKAKVNVAGHSVRTLQRHIQASNFSRDTKIQVREYLFRKYINYMYMSRVHTFMENTVQPDSISMLWFNFTFGFKCYLPLF